MDDDEKRIPLSDRPPAERRQWAQTLRQVARGMRQEPEIPAERAQDMGERLYRGLRGRILTRGSHVPEIAPADMLEQADREIAGHCRAILGDQVRLMGLTAGFEGRFTASFTPTLTKALSNATILGAAGLYIEAGRTWWRGISDSMALLLEAWADMLDDDNAARGAKVGQASSDGGRERARSYDHEQWQEQARALWAVNPRLSVSEVGRRIAEQTGGAARTIRRCIADLRPAL